jgi:hypothetical protein
MTRPDVWGWTFSYDTLFLFYWYDFFTQDSTNVSKLVRKYDDLGFWIQNENYSQWTEPEKGLLPSYKEEFLHGPSGLDTLHRGYLWDEDLKDWKLDFADTLTWNENGNWIDCKMTLWDDAQSVLNLWRRYVAEYDTNKKLKNLKIYGDSSAVTDLKTYFEEKYFYDINGNQILHTNFYIENEITQNGTKEYKYWSPPETSQDASLYNVSFTPGVLRPIIDGKDSKYVTLFDDEINEYYVFLEDTATVVPAITLVKNDPNSTLAVKEATDLLSSEKEDRTTTVTVTAEDGSTTQDYSFEFHVMDHLATLDTLWVSEGKLYPDFSPEILTYTDTIPGECPGVPTSEVTYKTSGPLATVMMTNASNICSKYYNKTWITVTADDGITTKNYKIIFLLTDINKIYSNDFVIYPNPVSEILKLEHSSPIMEVTMFNMLGQKVGRYELNSVTSGEISLAGLMKGVYFIRMRDESGQVYMKKVVKD